MKRVLFALGGLISLLFSGYSFLTAVLYAWMAVTPNFPKERLDEAHFITNLSLAGSVIFLTLGVLAFFAMWRSFKKSHRLNLK